MSVPAMKENPEPMLAQSSGDPVLDMIALAARDKSIDVDKFERMLLLKERRDASLAEAAFNDAMTKAQAEMRAVSTDANNTQTKSRYATYFALDRSLRPIYTRHGFSVTFNTEPGAAESMVRVVSIVAAFGHSRKYVIDMPADGKGAKGGDVMTKTHATGSAVQYGMRYLLKMIFNVAIGDDDDGNAAGAGELVSQEQIEQLIQLADEAEADKEKFCQFMRVPSLSQIPAKDFDRAINALTAKMMAKK